MNQTRLEAFVGQVVQDLAAGESAVATYLGDVLGLYRAMQGAGPVTSAELARRTGTHERYVREWLHNQVAGDYIEHQPDAGTFELTAEQGAVLADDQSPTYLIGILEILAAMWASADRVAHAFRTGEGVDYAEHDPRLTSGVGRLFEPLYRASLINEWIPAIDGLHDRLTAGANVLDVGCGTGVSSVLMAQAYPKSRFLGVDLDRDAIETASKAAAEAGVGDRVRFEVAAASSQHEGPYDLVTFFDALHDIGDPVRVATTVVDQLADDGILMAVEPAAGDRLEDNRNPISRLFYAGSIFVCTPSALAHGSDALGAQAGPSRLIEVLRNAGLTQARVAAQTPFNLILEGRP